MSTLVLHLHKEGKLSTCLFDGREPDPKTYDDFQL